MPALATSPAVGRLTRVEQLQLDRLLCGFPPTLREWNRRVRPAMSWDWPHLVMLQDALDRVAAGATRKLIVEIPVRHGKSETGTVSFPAQLLDEDPARRIIVGSYNLTLASRFSRKARKVASEAGVALSDERNAADDWETTAGGGVRAVGVGAGVTGTGGDFILVDDPVKSREEAESAVYREKVWDWFTSDLLTRLEPQGAIVVTMSRWHQDDLIGRILASEDAPNWEVIRLPALAEANDPLGRAEGAALCPERFDESALAAIQLAIGAYPFASLYQQAPQPRNAGMFPPDAVRIIPTEPAGVKWVRWWDFGASKGKGDFSVGAKVGVHQGRVIIADVRSGQWDAAARDRVIRQTAETDGPDITYWGEQEPGSGGKAQAWAFSTLLAGYPVFTERTTGDKASAMDPLASQWQAGNVDLVKSDWNRRFIDQAAQAPFGKNDDEVEAASRAYIKVAATPPAPRAWVF